MRLTIGNIQEPFTPPPPVGGATYNPADKYSGITLSGGNLIATQTAPVFWATAKGTSPQTAGKFYFETRFVSGSNVIIGIVNAAASNATFIGSDANGIGVYSSSGDVLSGSTLGNASPYAAGDYVRIAVDITAQRVWISKVGSAWSGGGDPATGSGGFSTTSLGATVMLAGSVYTNLPTPDALSLNTGQVAWQVTPPAGFVGWPP